MKTDTESLPGNRKEKEATTGVLVPVDTALLSNMPLYLEARLGDAEMTVAELMDMKAGSVVTLRTGIADHVDLYLNNAVVARGEIVAVGEKFGVRVTEVGKAARS